MGNKTHPTYDGTEMIEFRSGNHTYFHKKYGVVPNATGVCKVMAKPQLIPWAARKASEHWYSEIEAGVQLDEIQIDKLHEAAMKAYDIYSGERRDVGKHIHKWCEQMAHWEMGNRKYRPTVPVHAEIRNGTEAWNKWRGKPHNSGMEWLATERVFFHKDHIHVGTADGWVRDHETRYRIIDYKTGSGVWAEAGLQTASYAMSASLEFDIPIEHISREIVHLHARTGNVSVWDEDRIQDKLTGGDIATDYKCFVGLLAAYEWIVDGPNRWSFLGKA